MLQHKNAVIYGAGGSLGGAIAKALATAGGRVFLTGRNIASVQKVADEIIAAGGRAEVAQVDAFNETAINNHLEKMVQQAGTVDISFNATASKVVQNIPLTSMSVDDFYYSLDVNDANSLFNRYCRRENNDAATIGRYIITHCHPRRYRLSLYRRFCASLHRY
jgi:NADP-dependent 3-hydroxy acid dehydrogenase YdfG